MQFRIRFNVAAVFTDANSVVTQGYADSIEPLKRVVEEDRDVARALQHYRAARHSSPAKALDFLHRMTETIEYVYGGEAKALAELQYSKNALSDITRPANNKSYRARHEGGQNQDVPEDELKKAFAAADEILSRFLNRRLQEMAGA